MKKVEIKYLKTWFVKWAIRVQKQVWIEEKKLKLVTIEQNVDEPHCKEQKKKTTHRKRTNKKSQWGKRSNKEVESTKRYKS